MIKKIISTGAAPSPYVQPIFFLTFILAFVFFGHIFQGYVRNAVISHLKGPFSEISKSHAKPFGEFADEYLICSPITV